jgi:hypothetical protein
VEYLDYSLKLSGNISALSKDRTIRLLLYKSSLNSGLNKDSLGLVNSGSPGASGY